MGERKIIGNLTPLFIFLLLTATLGPLLFGYHLAELNAPQQVITCAKKSIDGAATKARRAAAHNGLNDDGGNLVGGLPQCIPMNELQFGAVSSSFTLGGLLGALIAGPVTGRYGRLKTMIYTCIFAIIGPLFEAFAPSIAVMTLGRFISGIGAGASTVNAPIYIGEISPPGQKGFFGTFTQVMINVGILIAQLEGLFLSRGSLWRIILAVAGAIALAQLIILLVAGQESPTWLASNGSSTKARRILRRIRGSAADLDPETHTWAAQDDRGRANGEEEEEATLLAHPDPADEALSDATAVPTTDVDTGPTSHSARPIVGILAVLRHPEHWRAVVAVVAIMTAQQFTGINSIVMYGVGLLSSLLAANAAVLNVGVSGVNVALTVVAAPLVERAGRRACLLASLAGMGVAATLLGVGIARALPVLCAVAVVAFVAAFGIGLGPVPFILAGELVSAEAVGAVQSWALAANWIATFVVAQFFPVVNSLLGKGVVYFIFAGFAAFFIAFILWWVPETKGKRDADEVWGRNKDPVEQT